MQRLDRERNEYVNTLLAQNRLSAILNDERDEEALLSRSIGAVMETLGFEMGCVYIKDEKDVMVPRVKKNMPESLEKMCVSGVFDTLFEQAFAKKTVIYLTQNSPAFATLDPAVQKSSVRTIPHHSHSGLATRSRSCSTWEAQKRNSISRQASTPLRHSVSSWERHWSGRGLHGPWKTGKADAIRNCLQLVTTSPATSRRHLSPGS